MPTDSDPQRRLGPAKMGNSLCDLAMIDLVEGDVNGA